VSLSVGGRIFKTRKTYLTKSSYLTDQIRSLKTVFIDRDPYYFEHILNYMRGNLSYLQITDANSLRILLNDAEFYKLHDMISDLKVAIKHRDGIVKDEIKKDSISFFSWFCIRSQNQIIRISIRGIVFETRRRTIMAFRGSVLSDIFNDDSVNFVFIDRDSTHFRHILNFYRGSCKILKLGVNSTIDISDYNQLKFLLKEVRFYKLDHAEKLIKYHMDSLSKKLELEEMHQSNIQSNQSYTRVFLQSVLPHSFYQRLPFSMQSINLRNSPVMIIVGKELFCANASSLFPYSEFARMLQDTTEYTSEGYPKLLINRPSTYFHYILNFLDGILK
jgi:hypothetical protein